MKLSISLSALLLVLPALVSASSIPVHVRGLNGDVYMPRNHARHNGRQRQGGFGGGRQSTQNNANKNKNASSSSSAQATATGGSTNASTESCPAPTTVTVTAGAGAAAATTDSTTTSTTAAAGTGNQNKNKNNNAASSASSTSTSTSTTTTASTTSAAASAAAAGTGNQNKNKNNNAASSASSTSTSTSTTTTASTTSAAASVAATVASNNNTGDPQTSLTLLSNLVAPGLKNDGQAVPVAGQVASLTTTNNFINFCVGKAITNGQQVAGGSCNPIPMGDIIPKANMPSCKFASPANQDIIPANQAFTIKMNINNMQAGVFTNAQKTYYMAPQQLNGQGILIGHSHFVIQKMGNFADPAILDAATFAFFKGINTPAQGGQLTADVTAGLPAGNYRLASINTDANHAPAIGAVAQHGWFDDIVYFTVQ